MFTYEGQDRIYIGARASLIETEKEIASDWAAKHILINPAHSWILGKFVEADRANKNKQFFSLANLEKSQPTIAHAPMNINHSPNNIVGAFVASELIFPTEEANLNPYIESLGVFWKYYFRNEYKAIKEAHDSGSLFYSMECVPRAISTIGGSYDDEEFSYEGVKSPNYPDEINNRDVPINLIDPHFVGGALIIPPEKPGWSQAEVHSISKYMEENWKMAEQAYDGIKNEASNLNPSDWETMMTFIMANHSQAEEYARSFNAEERQRLAKEGKALPDGSFPIVNVQDLKNAIQAVGRAKNRSTAIAHIKKRARALGATNLLPEGW